MSRSKRLAAAGLAVAVATMTVAAATVGQSPSAVPQASGAPPAGGVVTTTDAEGFAGSTPHAIAVGADGSLVMGGGTGPDPARPDNALAWHSIDGVHWSESVLPKSVGLSVSGITLTPTGWVALVTQPRFGGGLVYTSKDGETWKHGKDFGAYSVGGIIPTPDGFLVPASSYNGGDERPTVWRSANLKKWKETKVPGSGAGVDIAQLASGATVVLVDQVDDNHVDSYTYARSADGSEWETVPFPVVAASADETVLAGDLGVAGEQFVQVVNTRSGDVTTGAIWTSPDGETWTKGYESPVRLSQVASGPTGMVVGDDVEIISSDGVTWEPVAQPGLSAGAGAAAGLPDGRVVVAGSGYGDGGSFATAQVVPAPPGFDPSAPLAPEASQGPAASPIAVGQGPTDPLCDPLLTSATISAVTGLEVSAARGSTFGDATSCHWTLPDAADLILAVEPGSLAARLAQADGTGRKAPELGKTGYLTVDSVTGDPVLIWGKKAKGGDPGYALTLGGGGLDEVTLIELAKAVERP